MALDKIIFLVMIASCVAALAIGSIIFIRSILEAPKVDQSDVQLPKILELIFSLIFIAGGIWKLIESSKLNEQVALGLGWLLLGMYFAICLKKSRTNEKI